MVRLFHAYFPTRTLLLCMSELLLVLVSMIIGTVVSTGIADADLALMYEGGLMKIALVTGVVFVWMYYFDLYDTNVLGNRREVFTRITQVFGATCASLAAIYYMFPQSQLTMAVLGTGSLCVVLAWTAGRRLFLQVNTVSYFAERTLFLGHGPLIKPLIDDIKARPELGLAPIGVVSDGVIPSLVIPANCSILLSAKRSIASSLT
jgi:hypothetical protein